MTKIFQLPAAACHVALVLLLLALLGGCLTPEKDFNGSLADLERDPFNTARINCFLVLKDDRGQDIRMEVANLEVVADNFSQSIASGPVKVHSAAIGSGQLFMGGKALPPGRYQRLRLTVIKGEARKVDGRFVDVVPEVFVVETDITSDLDLEAGESRTLLITWDVKNSVKADNVLQPELTVTSPLKQMLVDLIFVACPDIDTVFVVRADKNWVVDSFGLTGEPTYMVISPGNRNLLYVLAARERMVKVVELATQRVVNFFQVPLNDNPTFMALGPEGESAFLLDEQSGYLNRISLSSGASLARVLLNDRPNYVTYLQDIDLLAVSLSLSNTVVLLDPETLQLKRTFPTGIGPGGAVAFDNLLLVAEYGDNTVSIFDITSRGAQSRLSVGFGPRRLLKTGQQIFVSNYLEGSLSVLLPRQFGVIQDIYGLGRPLEMIFDQSYRRLYVADQKNAALAVIDTNSNRLIGKIALGARPLGLEIIQ